VEGDGVRREAMVDLFTYSTVQAAGPEQASSAAALKTPARVGYSP
jgi:hypothetical protein